jgi:4-aminobutyrate aminotransferase-like enzyme/Ser/Thr protein kinase RdoA (MazF antagonist)
MADDFAAVAAEHFGIEATARALPGEIDTNARLDTEDGRAFVLRLSPPGTDSMILDFQSAVLRTLGRLPELRVPTELLSKRGLTAVALPDGRVARVFTWVPGASFTACDRPPGAAGSIGYLAGAVVNALADLEHPAADRELAWDLRHAAATITERAGAVTDPHRRRILDEVALRIGRLELAGLPTQVIHNDLNDENVLFDNERVVGIIDVGDSVRSMRIGEVAIAAAYTMLGQDDPISVGADVIRGFATAVEVTEAEAHVIFDLVLARLATSVAISAHRGNANPHHTVSEPMARDLLERLTAADTATITAEWLEASGHESRPSGHRTELEAERRRRLGPALSLSYTEPLHIVRGKGSYLFDERGRRYVDAVNNVAHVGHSHPRVTMAAAEQMARLNTNTRYLHQEVLDYAARLADTLPEPLEVVFLVNSGSEANELAIRLVRTASGAADVACLDHGYHGNTTTLVDVSPYKFNGPGGEGRRDWVVVLPAPDPYRNEQFRGPAGPAHYRTEADTILANAERPIAGLIAETLPGCAGQIVPDPGILAAAYAAVRERGGLVIADEVQTGFGRVGAAFWAFELHGVRPDVVTMGKPIGNGHPLGAVVTTREVAAAFDSGMEYFNTFGGNPVSAAVGNAVLDVIEDERLQEHARSVGAELRAALGALGEDHAQIGDVRGAGLFIGVEIVEDPLSKVPAATLARQIIERAKSEGVLLSSDGPGHNVIKIKPPLVFSADDATRLVAAISGGLEAANR